MGEFVDAIKAIAELGKGSVKVAQPEAESTNKEVEKYKVDLLRTEAYLSLAKVLIVVIGATLVMWLAGDHVVGLLRPKPPSLTQRIETFSSAHNSSTAAKYLDDCIKELQSLRKSLAAEDVSLQEAKKSKVRGKPGVAETSSLASEPPRIPRQQVTTLRSACSQIVGE